MKLKLTKPLVVFDLETTGVDVSKDRIVEISVMKIHPNGEKEVKTRRINPEMPIPKASSDVHGIYDEDVKDEFTFKAVAKSLALFIGNSDLAGYNSNKFDVPLLVEEFLRSGVDFEMDNRKLVDVQNIFHQIESRTLVASYEFYCGKDLENAHSAEADVEATYEVLEAIINRAEELTNDVDLLSSFLDKVEGDDNERLLKIIKKKQNSIASYSKIENNIDFLSDFSERDRTVDLLGRIVYNEEDVPVFNFGKYKGSPVKEVLENDQGYYSWIMNGDFPAYTKKVLTAIKLEGAFNK